MFLFLKGLWSNRQFIVGLLLVLFLTLFVWQCNKTKEANQKLYATEQIAKQNVAALGDSSVQLRLTKDQLLIVDNNLHNALTKIDSIGHIKSKNITFAKPTYLGGDVKVAETLVYDSIKQSHGLTFYDENSVRTIGGTSWFKLKKDNITTYVVPDSTKITDFKMNFALVISQYNDDKTKYTRTKILPFNIKSDGTLGDQIPDTMLRIDYRNAEILDKPFTPNKPVDPAVKPNSLIQTGWGLTLSPLAVGLYPTQSGGVKFGYTPNIGISYYITLRKK